MGLNKIAEGESIQIAIPAGGCSIYTPVLIGADMVGVPANSYAASTDGNVEIHLEGIFSGLAKAPNDSFAVGDRVYWRDGSSVLTTTDSFVFAGWCAATAAVGDTTMTLRLKHG